MAESLTEPVRNTLSAYLRDIRILPNESAKVQRFSVLMGELFRGYNAITQYARGIEKLIRINTGDGSRRGYADAYYGNAIIEFENSLDATLDDAEDQLRMYAAGLWQKKGENAHTLLAIASDGITWRIYRPLCRKNLISPHPADVDLDFLREIRLSDSTLGEFWLWLNQVLFRPQQVPATADWFQNDFGSLSPLYKDALHALESAWMAVRQQPEAQLAFETWQKYLTVTYGKLTDSAADRLQTLFLKHTYLCSLARLLVWASLSRGKTMQPLRKVAQDVLSGKYFESAGLANLVEDDFFHWIRETHAASTLAGTWERILAHILGYDLAHLGEDVLKGVYQQLIDPEDRHDLGEYYTPDWLCERMVKELLPAYGFKTVLDPSCGSGGFLRAAIMHFRAVNQELKGEAGLRKILESVQGIDIHPVAVTISRATYVLALGPLAKAAKRPIQIPVYLADSLFLPSEVEESPQGHLYKRLRGIEISFGQRPRIQRVVIPQDLVSAPKLFDEAITACSGVAEEHARTGSDTRSSLEKHLSKAVPELDKTLGRTEIIDALWEFTEGLAELIRHRGNSIWAFIVRNSYRPAMLRSQFDVIIGNPPWLSYRYIADPEYQAEVKKRAVEEYFIAPRSQKLFTQMELATVFYAHAMATFARPHAHIGFVMPRGVLSADQHQNLIRREYKAPFRLTGYWDLMNVAPLFNVPACVLFGKQDKSKGDAQDALRAVIWEGNLPERNAPWSVAANNLRSQNAHARVIYLGSRCAISEKDGASTPSEPSHYQRIFKNGATIYPRNIYFVQVKDLKEAPDPDKAYWIETDPEQAREAKPPYKEIHLSGLAEGKFLYAAVIAKHILPFAVLNPATVVLPLENDAHGLRMLTADALTKEGYRDTGKWFRQAERIWNEKRGEKAGRQNLYEWLNYQGKLTAQDLTQRHLVLYTAEGANVAAVYYDRESRPLKLLVEHVLYWATLPTAQEAYYLTSILNCAAINEAIKPFQARGLLGPRHIQKKVLELPVPRFDNRNTQHRMLAEFGRDAHERAQKIAPTLAASRVLGRQRSIMRRELTTILGEIDQIVLKLLENPNS